jgi:hypothetical protein
MRYESPRIFLEFGGHDDIWRTSIRRDEIADKIPANLEFDLSQARLAPHGAA